VVVHGYQTTGWEFVVLHVVWGYVVCVQVKHKYDDTVMSLFTEVFNSIPLAAVINSKVKANSVVVSGVMFVLSEAYIQCIPCAPPMFSVCYATVFVLCLHSVHILSNSST
jgi:hypothetical protein